MPQNWDISEITSVHQENSSQYCNSYSHSTQVVYQLMEQMPPVPLTRAQMCVLNFFPLYCIDESAGEEGGEKKNGE